MSKFNFENLHRNHKWAFADGFLCGLITIPMAMMFAKVYRELKATPVEVVEYSSETDWLIDPK